MFTKLTHNDLEVIQGGAVCLMPNVNNKEGDPLKTVGYHQLDIEAVKPIPWYIYLSVLLCKNFNLRLLFDKNIKVPLITEPSGDSGIFYIFLPFRTYSHFLGR
ncbi:MAG: hypothetical protein ACLUMQ_01955 [Streptococcus salivarius]